MHTYVHPSLVMLTRDPPRDSRIPGFVSAEVLPGHAMMLLQIVASFPGLGEVQVLASPERPAALATLAANDATAVGGDHGNSDFSMGAAFLAPYANRIPGELAPDGATIVTRVLDRPVRLPANWGGTQPGAPRYAMHGLTLGCPVQQVTRHTDEQKDSVSGVLDAGDFHGHWLSRTRLEYRIGLSSSALSASVIARNVGSEQLPVGIGWHPYFALPSGRRDQARLRIPARERLLVDNYDDVLPTGAVVPVRGTTYDFSGVRGRELGSMYLDDCFVSLERTATGGVVCEVIDPSAHYGVRVIATSPQVRAVQVFAPPERDVVALEPQFNWADPFGGEWAPGTDTGMVLLNPGEQTSYDVRLELFVP